MAELEWAFLKNTPGNIHGTVNEAVQISTRIHSQIKREWGTKLSMNTL